MVPELTSFRPLHRVECIHLCDRGNAVASVAGTASLFSFRAAIMRLRYRPVDWFLEASRLSREECLGHALPLPVVTALEERFDSSGEFDGAFSSCFRNLVINSSSSKASLELPPDIPCVEETNTYDKFLSQIFPSVQPLNRSNIDLGEGEVTVAEAMCNWFCSDVQHELQIQEEDVDMTCSRSQRIDADDIRPEDVNGTCSRSQRIDTSEINEEDVSITSNRSQRCDISEIQKVTTKSIIYNKVPNSSSCSEQSTFEPYLKKKKPPRSTISEFLEIEPPLLELRNCIPRQEYVSLLFLSQDWSRVDVDLGGAPLSAVETENAAFKFTLQQAWLDFSTLPCSPKRCYKNCSSTEEGRSNDIQQLLQFDKACLSLQYPDKTSDQIVRIQPIETLMIPEKLDWQTMDEEETTYPIKPNCLLQWFASHGNEIVEREAESLGMADFNTKMSVVDIILSKVVYYDEYPQPAMLLPGLLCDQCDSKPCCTSGTDPATDSFRGANLKFEIPATCDWNLSSLVNTSFCIIASDEETLVPDLPRLYPSRSFESSVVILELSLDDNQFQSLPVPLVTGPLDDMIDADLGRMMSLKCEPSTVPATDWLYLDWHFFHALKCTNATCFSLQAKMTEASQCRPLPCTSLTAEVTSQKRSEIASELRLLEGLDCPRDLSLNSHATGTMREDIEALVRSPLAGTFQTQGKGFFRAPEIQKSQERACKLLPQTPGAIVRPRIDMIDANSFLPACPASNLLQYQWSTGADGRNADLQVQKYDSNSVSKQRPQLENIQPLERLGIREPESLRKPNKGGDIHFKFQQETPSNDLGRRRELRPTSIQNGSDFMESDFNFFAKARKGVPSSGTDLQITKDSEENSSIALNGLQYISTSQPALITTPESDDEHHTSAAADCCVHVIEISLEIRKCIVSLSSNYFLLLALDEIVDLTIPGDFKVLKQFDFDADGNSHLISIINDVASKPASPQRQLLLRGLIALHVLRHTARNLCDYGIQVAHLYLENCFERMQFLEGYIMSSRTELEEAYNQVEKGVVEDHPKLSSLDKLLHEETLEANDEKYLSRRILLLADRRAFFTVVRKLLSLGLTPYQIDRKESYLHNGVLQEDSMDSLKEEVLEALTFSDCLLVSHAYLNPSFPVQRFTMIIQYADPPSSDANNRNWTRRKCDLHVFKLLVQPEEFQAKLSSSSPQRQAFDNQDPQGYNLSEQNEAGLGSSTNQSSSLKNVVPSENNAPESPSSRGAKDHPVEENRSLDGRCEMIIVANISHPNDHMLTGRRSSYQKILRLEKENFQVVERELRLPVDLILSPASCLVIYTLGKLNLEPHSLKDKQTALQKDVVTHLKAISFSFRDCIMIFEGPTEFTKAALGIFTRIYALAISLEMQFQCFASRHPEVTDAIVMNFIQAVRRSRKTPSCPIMTEGPTLAEVFLTEFPSINPLVAHAILSSGCPLPVFISYTPEQQFAALEEYEVPKHCLDLFKAQCTYKAIAIKTTAVSNYEVVESQTDQAADEETPYLHQVDPQAVSLPYQRPTSDVRASFLEFPPAFAVSGYSPAHHVSSTYKISDISPAFNVSNSHQLSSFPDFPPISQVQGCEAEDPEERELTSTALYGTFDILKHSPAEFAGMKSVNWSHSLDADDVPVYEGAAPKKSDARDGIQQPQEIYAQDDINWLSKDFGCEEFKSGPDMFRVRNTLQHHQRSSSADYSFELGRRHWPRETSAALVNGSERLRERKLHGEYEILLDSGAEMSGHLEQIPRPQNGSKPTTDDSGLVGLKRGASTLSFISPTFFGIPRQETGLDTAFGNWNGHKRVRGVARSSINETFNLQEDDSDDRFASKVATGPTFLDDFSDVGTDWLDNTASVHEEASVMSKSSMQQSRRPQTETLNASSLDRFRYRQTGRPAPGTASKNYTQGKTKFPRKLAPPRSRTKSPSVNYYLHPATIPKPAFKRKNPSETPVDGVSKMILGCARRGSDTQQRLVWRNNPFSSSSKRQRIDVISSP